MNRLIIIWILLFWVGFCFSQSEFSPVDFDDNLFNRTDIPAAFDLRDFDRICQVKVQPTGGCWASSAIGSVESFRKSACTMDTVLSDTHLTLYHGFDSVRSTSGNHYMATAYFSRGNGPVVKNPESDSIYNPQPEIITYVSDARYLPDDPYLIKQVMMDYGAVYSMMYFRKEFLDTITDVFYTPQKKINHAIILVGWNDNFITNVGNGVWIAQNSLGTNFGDGGFFYIPYQDPNILAFNAVWPKWMDYSKRVKLFYYDTLGSFNSYGFRDTICYGLVKFETNEKVVLNKIGTSINVGSTKIYAEVYQDFDTVSKKLSGILGNIDPMECRFPGYYTFDLNQTIPLNSGDDFFVLMQYVTPNDTLPLPVETFIEGYSDPHIVKDKCWINPDFEKWSTTWYKCGPNSQYANLNFDLCIKAIGIRSD